MPELTLPMLLTEITTVMCGILAWRSMALYFGDKMSINPSSVPAAVCHMGVAAHSAARYPCAKMMT